MYSDYYSPQQRDKFTYEKMFFSNHFPFFLRSFFIITNVNFEIFIKTPVFLYFYDEARSSHRRCSMKKLFLKISQYSKKTSLWSLF